MAEPDQNPAFPYPVRALTTTVKLPAALIKQSPLPAGLPLAGEASWSLFGSPGQKQFGAGTDLRLGLR